MMRTRLKVWILSAILVCCCCGIDLSAIEFISLKGYLGEDETVEALKQVEAWHETPPEKALIEVDSSSGDLKAVLLLAQRIYELKQEHSVQIVVYLGNNVLGPGAILPFLADELLSSPFVSWGAIPLGSESTLPLNVLRNRVTSLIASQGARGDLLKLLARAMVDPALTVTNEDGWRIRNESVTDRGQVISPKGETLVISHNQLKELGLVERFVRASELQANYGVELIPTEANSASVRRRAVSGTVNERLEAHIRIDEARPLNIGHLIIDDKTVGITPGTWLYVKSALDYYKETKPAFIILELNTPGGQVYPSQQISDALKEMDTQYGIPVVAYINNWAISAGAMLAYSCRFIVIAKDASMGAAAPVFQTQEGMEAAPEKVNSAFRSDFANRARFFGRNGLLAEAMVDKDMILVRRHGKIVKVDTEEQIRRDGPDPDEMISAKGKLLTLNAEEMMDLGVADLRIESVAVTPIGTAEEGQGLWPASKMQLFQHEYFKRFSHGTVDSYQGDWKIDFLAMLTHPVVSSLIFLGLFLGFYIEMSSPGFGIPGAVAILCLFLVLLSSFAMEAASWLEVILIIAGLVLLGLELFVIPGFGVAGLAGIAAIIVGLFALMLPGLETVSFDQDSNTWNAAGEVFMERLVWLCGSLVVGLVVVALLARYVLPRFTAFNRLVLTGEQDSSEGYVAGVDPRTLPPPGSQGVVEATLRPSGSVIIDDVLYTATSVGGFIEKGTDIEVLRLDGSRVIVVSVESDIETL